VRKARRPKIDEAFHAPSLPAHCARPTAVSVVSEIDGLIITIGD
jgi:hypothetical protein